VIVCFVDIGGIVVLQINKNNKAHDTTIMEILLEGNSRLRFRAGLSDTILKREHTTTIPSQICFNLTHFYFKEKTKLMIFFKVKISLKKKTKKEDKSESLTLEK
jgi:hypothetical protein